MMIRSDRLSNFVVFAETLSFTHAARRLRLSQPALHVQVTQLAETVGVPLYVREGRGLRLTAAGARLAAFGREQADRTNRLLAELRGAPAGPVILCAGEAITRYRLVDRLRGYPAPLRLLVGNAEQTADQILDGLAHVGVTGALSPRDGLVSHPFVEVPQMLAVPTEHPLASTSAAPLDALAGESLVVPPADRPHRQALALALGSRPWRVAVEVSGWDLMLKLVSAGFGLAVVNGIVVPPDDVVLVPLPELPKIRYDVLIREGDPVPAVQHLMATLMGEISGGA